MIPDDLRLQMGPVHYVMSGLPGTDATRLSLGPQFRFAREGGWHCGHWHYSIEAALNCMTRRTRTAKRAA